MRTPEKIYDVYWEGPFPWEERRKRAKPHHVLYALYGSHHLYGRDVLLYIGMSNKSVRDRYPGTTWVDDEYDAVTIRLASVGPFSGWREWELSGNYQRPSRDLVDEIEALLIYSHQPPYNSQKKQNLSKAKGLRLFNSGRSGQLFPEVSYLYHNEDLPRLAKRES